VHHGIPFKPLHFGVTLYNTDATCTILSSSSVAGGGGEALVSAPTSFEIGGTGNAAVNGVYAKETLNAAGYVRAHSSAPNFRRLSSTRTNVCSASPKRLGVGVVWVQMW
jgi:hypothetical protein